MRPALVLVFLPAFALVVLGLPLSLRVAALEAFVAEGPSMAPTLCNGDRFAVDKHSFGLFLPFTAEQQVSWGAPEPGDIVVIKSPLDNVDIVKRVVAVGGDRVEWRGNMLSRNGKPLLHELVECPAFMKPLGNPVCEQERLGDRRYIVASDPRRSVEPLSMDVPEGHVYVLGDFRTRSNDSRNPSMGAISQRRIKGRVTRIYYSEVDSSRAFTVPQ